MNNFPIREAREEDLPELVEIWFTVSLVAHNFIPPSYWEENREAMLKRYLPESEIYVAVDEEKIVGFVSLSEAMIEALFVGNEFQRCGIGSLLVNHVKKMRDSIKLKVYKANKGSLAFYEKQGFKVTDDAVDSETGEPEYVMEWREK